jgi:hypothetical protein
MSRPVTLEDIFQLFDRQKEETELRAAQSQAEAERRAAQAQAEAEQRAAQAQAEAEHRAAQAQAEAEHRAAQAQAEAERRSTEAQAEAERRAAEWERSFAAYQTENDRSVAELKRLVAASNEIVNNLTSRWGRFVEELVKPGVAKLFKEKGIDIKHTFLRAEAPDNSMEIDVLGVNSTDVVLVECKSRLTQDNVDELLDKLPNFTTAFSEFRNYRIYGAVAGIEVDQGVDRYAYKKGLFVIKPSGDTIMIVNDDKFRPRVW